MKAVQELLMAIAVLGLLAVAGCKQPSDYTMQRNRIFLMGRLLVGKTCDVRLIWRKAPDEPAPATVTANLSGIGGLAEQQLTASDNGTWRWSGQVAPDTSGERLITITVADSQAQTKEVGKRFPVFNTDKAVAIGAGGAQRLAVKADGTVVAWGCDDLYASDNLGQCDVPSTITNAVAVAGGYLALNADGTVATWGKYYKAEPDNDSVIIPNEVPERLSDVVAIAGSSSSLALKADGTVVAWGGDNFYGECDVPSGLTDVVAISAGRYTSFALKADGSVVSWGDEVTMETSNAIVVSAGSSGCTFVLNEHGKAALYGSASSYCADIPVRAGGGFKAIAAGDAGNGMGLRNDGSVVSWAYIMSHVHHSYVNEGPENVLAIAIGQYSDFRLTLAEDGTLKDWFDDWYGHRENPIPDELQ